MIMKTGYGCGRRIRMVIAAIALTGCLDRAPLSKGIGHITFCSLCIVGLREGGTRIGVGVSI